MKKKSKVGQACDLLLREVSSLLGATVGTQFGTRSYTRKGEYVRSKSEKKVADFLREKAIHYEYEKKLIIDGKSVKPDFFLPDHDTVIEFFGLQALTHKRKHDYWKMELYEKSGYNFIPVFEEDLERLDYVIKPRLK